MLSRGTKEAAQRAAARASDRSRSGGLGDLAAAGAIVGAALAGVYFKDSIRASSAYRLSCDGLAMPFVRLFDAETAHRLAVRAAALRLTPLDAATPSPKLATTVWGVDFANVVGLAAGFDKHAEAIGGLADLGFGFVEIGSVTPEPQPGNPTPRMFRLSEDRAVINRYGFNSEGHAAVKTRLELEERLELDKPRGARLGVNVGKNKTHEDAAADYCQGITELGPYADYVVVNVSSPNTPGLRSLQKKEAIAGLMRATVAARDEVARVVGRKIPLLVKVAPDLDEQEKKDIADAAMECRVDGLIVSNTTIDRPETLQSTHKGEGGGLSGAPLRVKATQAVSDFYRLTQGKLPLVGVGGVGSGEDAFEKILAGASLVQLYSLLVFTGPGAIVRLKEELLGLLEEHGFEKVGDAVGAYHRGFRWTHPANAS